MIYDRIKQGVRDAIRRARDPHGAFDRLLFSLRDTAQGDGMMRHQEVSPEKKVKLGGRECVIRAMVIDSVDNNKKIRWKLIVLGRNIFVHLGQARLGDAIFNGQGVEMKYLLKNRLIF